MKIQSNTQTRHCPQCGTVMEDQAVTWVNVQEELVSVASIRADERAKCRAELVSELNTRAMLDMTDKYEDLIRWARTEAFGGE